MQIRSLRHQGILVMLFAVSVLTSSYARAQDEDVRSPTVLDLETREYLRREATAPADSIRCEAIEHLCQLHDEARRHPRFGKLPMLEQLATRIRLRLRAAREVLQRDWRLLTERSRRDATEESEADGLEGHPGADESDLSPGDDEGRVPAPQAELAALAITDQLNLAAGASGGPVVFWSAYGSAGGPNGPGAPGGAAFRDFAPDLIELIESTIEPDHWDVAGGPGTIRYYRPVFALVVRASDDVHRQIGGFLGRVGK